MTTRLEPSLNRALLNVATSLLVTATDPELPELLKGAVARVTFTTAKRLQAVMSVKPGPMVILLDETQAELVADLQRTDVRAVAIVTAQAIPVVFRHPVVAVLERPLRGTRVMAALEQALGELQQPSADSSHAPYP